LGNGDTEASRMVLSGIFFLSEGMIKELLALISFFRYISRGFAMKKFSKCVIGICHAKT